MLKQVHGDLDAAVLAAYGWLVTLTDEEILERLVALNAEQVAEEHRSLVRWLRPEFQHPQGAARTALDKAEGTEAVAAVDPLAANRVAGGNAGAGQSSADGAVGGGEP